MSVEEKIAKVKAMKSQKEDKIERQLRQRYLSMMIFRRLMTIYSTMLIRPDCTMRSKTDICSQACSIFFRRKMHCLFIG